MKKLNNGGFSLIEVLAALAVLGCAIDLAVSSYNTITLSESRVTNFTRAHNIGISLVEQLMANFSTDANLTTGTHSLFYDSSGNLQVTTGFYTASWTVTANAPIANTLQVQIYVSWVENGSQRTLQFLTFRRS